MRLLRRLLGHDVSDDRERKLEVASQLSVDSEQVTADAKRELRRAHQLLDEDRRLAQAVKRTVHAVRGGE